jgi:CBS domain-containing protein
MPTAARTPRLRDIMVRDPVIVHVDLALAEAAVRMKEAEAGALFVVDGDEVVGVVTDRDLVVRGLASENAASIIDVMTRHVVACHESSTLRDAAHLMAAQRVRRLAVLNDDRELTGVVSLGDLARAGETTRAAAALRAICERIGAAKTPAREDPTGGRARGSAPGTLHVYSRRPRLRRAPRLECGRLTLSRHVVQVHILSGMPAQDLHRACLVLAITGANPEQNAAARDRGVEKGLRFVRGFLAEKSSGRTDAARGHGPGGGG